jgi:diaminohydroxyphosphoribosylaminopyrimidine deaminase/5-amino-6-(5-phosphoribosylamino)uracil reductase
MISRFMQRALELADPGIGATSPNPSVGCVIVRGSEIAGEGATGAGGRPHAETEAVAAAGSAARGAVVYTTLEPCSHHGQTPPCAQALIDARVATVHVALADPDPNVDNRGIEMLRAAGIAVHVGDGAAEVSRQLEGYLRHRRTGLPFVVVKFAATLDGKIAAASGDSRWVAGEKSRAWAHQFRTKVDAIMCGVNNVLLDDPQLTARPGGVAADRQPLRIIADSRGRTPLTAKALGPGGRTLIATTEAAPESWREAMRATGAEVCVLPADQDGRVDMRGLMHVLGDRGVLTLLCEGGGVLHASLFAAGLADKVHAIVAPKIVGGAAYPAVAGQGVTRMAAAVTLRDIDVQRLGDDVVVTGYVPRD